MMSSQSISRKRSASDRPKEEGNDCGTLAKKIKNIHLSHQLTTDVEPCGSSSSNDDSASSSEPLNEVYPVEADRDRQQKMLSDQVVNYSNHILGNSYTPSLGPDQNSEYFETNRVLFEANKMRLLRAQMRLLEPTK
jgi:hypothetical protein